MVSGAFQKGADSVFSTSLLACWLCAEDSFGQGWIDLTTYHTRQSAVDICMTSLVFV
jgi:hypothetical protein